MALVNSGNPISMGGSTTGQSINLELGHSATTQISLNDTDARALANITTPAAQISLSSFYGKSSATTYHSWTGGTYSYDLSYGDTTTADQVFAYPPTGRFNGSSNAQQLPLQCTDSRTGMNTVSLKLRATWTIPDPPTGFDTPEILGDVSMQYSWDGAAWYTVFGPRSDTNTSTSEVSYSLSNFTGATNLSSLRVCFIFNASCAWDSGKGDWDIPFGQSLDIFDVAVTVT